MTLEQKKKALDAYNPQDYYVKNAYIDAQDTTNVFMMAKIKEVDAISVDIGYDGWSERWDCVSYHILIASRQQ